MIGLNDRTRLIVYLANLFTLQTTSNTNVHVLTHR
jgi:hypothetical protein